jgi:transposase
LYCGLVVCWTAAAWLANDLHRCAARGSCVASRFSRNKNDRNDARGIADLMRVNKYPPVRVKSPEAPRQGRLPTTRAA